MELKSIFKPSIMQLEPENNQKNVFITELGRLIVFHAKVVAGVCPSIIKTILCFDFHKLKDNNYKPNGSRSSLGTVKT